MSWSRRYILAFSITVILSIGGFVLLIYGLDRLPNKAPDSWEPLPTITYPIAPDAEKQQQERIIRYQLQSLEFKLIMAGGSCMIASLLWFLIYDKFLSRSTDILPYSATQVPQVSTQPTR